MDPRTIRIGELARQSEVSVQTLRHYDRLGLLRPSEVTKAGYRLYTDADRARLELIRSLRALDFDLPTIARLLRGAASAKEAVSLQLGALELQAKLASRRAAVLRVLLRDPRSLTPERLSRLQGLSGLEAAARAQFLSQQLTRRLSDTAPPSLRQWIHDAAVVDLPDDPTPAQVEAWLELAEMVSDPTFLARHRKATPPSWANKDASLDRWRREQMAIARQATAAVRRGIQPDAKAARPIIERWLRFHGRRAGRRSLRGTALQAFARETLAAFERGRDPREERFWVLLGTLNSRIAQSPMSIGWPWLMEGLAKYRHEP
jgi:DNA-binding transcriptional MerR regulator